jgi:hypothetical protein
MHNLVVYWLRHLDKCEIPASIMRVIDENATYTYDGFLHLSLRASLKENLY